MLSETWDAVVIGAGQAGLATSFHLGRRDARHVVLDANAAPGGAWQHRWDSLRMDDVHGIADLPDAAAPHRSERRANAMLPDYFADYERRHQLPVVRPVRVDRVESDGDWLVVRAAERAWRTRTLANATGTWTRPFVPHCPGIESFAGEQVHTAHYPGADHFRAAIDHLAPLRLRTPEGGVALAAVSGNVQAATTAVRDARVQLVGYGPSASTIGAGRAGRDAAVSRHLSDAAVA